MKSNGLRLPRPKKHPRIRYLRGILKDKEFLPRIFGHPDKKDPKSLDGWSRRIDSYLNNNKTAQVRYFLALLELGVVLQEQIDLLAEGKFEIESIANLIYLSKIPTLRRHPLKTDLTCHDVSVHPDDKEALINALCYVCEDIAQEFSKSYIAYTYTRAVEGASETKQ